MNLMNVDGYHAKIDYDEETDRNLSGKLSARGA